jgi:hypothetical protein
MSSVNWTTVIATAIASAINGIAVYLAIRYFGRALDRAEKGFKKLLSKEDDNVSGKDASTSKT